MLLRDALVLCVLLLCVLLFRMFSGALVVFIGAFRAESGLAAADGVCFATDA